MGVVAAEKDGADVMIKDGDEWMFVKIYCDVIKL